MNSLPSSSISEREPDDAKSTVESTSIIVEPTLTLLTRIVFEFGSNFPYIVPFTSISRWYPVSIEIW